MFQKTTVPPELPPPDRPYLMFWFLLTWALMIIALVCGISWCKVETEKVNYISKEYFLEAQNKYEIYLSFTGNSLVAQAPAYLIKGKTYGIITAYNPVEEQCDSTPDITASGKKVKEGYIANNCLPFGTIVIIDGKQYEVQDRMNSRYGCEYFDILMWDYKEAVEFGKQVKEIKHY